MWASKYGWLIITAKNCKCGLPNVWAADESTAFRLNSKCLTANLDQQMFPTANVKTANESTANGLNSKSVNCKRVNCKCANCKSFKRQMCLRQILTCKSITANEKDGKSRGTENFRQDFTKPRWSERTFAKVMSIEALYKVLLLSFPTHQCLLNFIPIFL